MALSAQVIKKAVSGSQARINTITLTLVITDTLGPGLTKDYSCEFRSGDSISVKVNQFILDMNADIFIYKTQQTIFTNTALDSAVISIQGGLVL